MKRFLLPLFVGALLVAPWTTVLKADTPSAMKPVVVVSMAGYDAIKADVAFIGKLIDNPELATGMEVLLKLFTKGQGLAGLDKSRPWGSVLLTDGDKKAGYGFLPITDLAQLFDVMKPLIGEPEEVGDGIYKIHNRRGTTTYVKENASWAFFSDRLEHLADLPADPQKLLGDLPKQYDAALRLMAGNVPERLRAKLIAEMEQRVAQEVERPQPHESEAMFAARKQVLEEMLKVLLKVVDEVQDVTLGLALDAEAEKCYLDVVLTAKEGSEMAQAAANLKDAKTQFAGFRRTDAVLTGRWAGQAPEFKRALVEKILEAMHQGALSHIHREGPWPTKAEADKAKAAEELVEQTTALLGDTLRSGRNDGGIAVLLKPEAATIVAGGYIANDGRIEAMAKKIYKAAKAEDPRVGEWKVKFDADECQDVQLHTISIPVPPEAENRKKVVSLIGETLEVVIGTGKQCVYLAAGRDPLQALKDVINNSAASGPVPVPPVEISLSVGKLAEFIAAVGKDHERPKAEFIVEQLNKSTGDDHLKFTAVPIENGVKYRLEMEPSLVRLLGRLLVHLPAMAKP